MRYSVHISRSAPSDRDFAHLTQNISRLHPGWFPQWGEIVSRGLRQELYTVEVRKTLKDPAPATGSAASEAGEIAGILPLIAMKSPLFGRHLIALPYVNVGGCFVPEGKKREEIETLLIDEAVRLAEELDVKYLELRHVREIAHPRLNFERRGKVLMELELPETSEALWKAVGPKVRNQIRKGEKAGLRAEWGGKEFLSEFYAVFAETMRNVGTPVYSRKLFEEIFEKLGEKAEICLVRTAEDRLVSAAFLVHGREITEVPSAGTLRWGNALCANMFLYWNLLKHSIEARHAKVFDFGRSSIGCGTWQFKKQWGAQEVPVVWKYFVRRGTMDDVRPDNASYGLAIRIWKRLPVWFTKLIGPWIVRGIP